MPATPLPELAPTVIGPAKPPTRGTGGPSSGQLSATATRPYEDLTSEKLIQSASRVDYEGRPTPALLEALQVCRAAIGQPDAFQEESIHKLNALLHVPEVGIPSAQAFTLVPIRGGAEKRIKGVLRLAASLLVLGTAVALGWWGLPRGSSEGERDEQSGIERPAGKNPLELDLGQGVKLELVLLPAGSFLMGSPPQEHGRSLDEGPYKEKQISRPFYMGKYEVTQDQYRQVSGVNPSHLRCEKGGGCHTASHQPAGQLFPGDRSPGPVPGGPEANGEERLFPAIRQPG